MKQRTMIAKHTRGYAVSESTNFWHTLGFALIYLLIIQIITGIFLSAFYVPLATHANYSIRFIEGEIQNGWFVRRCHIVGASMLFGILYLHFIKALYYRGCRYANRSVYWSGLICWYLMMAIAFTGYVLPWGQMSFWGATVITNFFSVIPVIGPYVKQLIWGSSVIGNMTLKRFFLFHYLMPMVLLYIMFVHIGLIHYVGNTTRVPAQHFVSESKSSSLYPDFIEKDILTCIVVSMVFIYFVCFNPFYFDNPVNNIPGNALSTPKHIVPEWYFLPFYLVLKLISIKWLGIVAMLSLILFPAILPFLEKPLSE